jgi:hypothetical protein
MLRSLLNRLLPITTLAILLGPDAVASANWVTIRNDTGKPIIVQETVVANGKVRRGKATNLLAGETHREYLPGPTVKRIEVFEAGTPTQVRWSGTLTCPDDSQGFCVANSNGKITVSPVVRPARK